jgi:hypothetical protein
VYYPIAEASSDHLDCRGDVSSDEPARRLADETERAEEREPVVRDLSVRKPTAVTESGTTVVGIARHERDRSLVCFERVKIDWGFWNALEPHQR